MTNQAVDNFYDNIKNQCEQNKGVLFYSGVNDISKPQLKEALLEGLRRAVADGYAPKEINLNETLAPAQMIAEILRIAPTIQEVKINDNKLNAEDMGVIADAIKAHGGIRVLDVSHNPIGNEGFAHLADLSGLRELHASNNGLDAGAQTSLGTLLTHNPTLVELHVPEVAGSTPEHKQAFDQVVSQHMGDNLMLITPEGAGTEYAKRADKNTTALLNLAQKLAQGRSFDDTDKKMLTVHHAAFEHRMADSEQIIERAKREVPELNFAAASTVSYASQTSPTKSSWAARMQAADNKAKERGGIGGV